MNRVQPDTSLPKIPPKQIIYKANLTQASTNVPTATVIFKNYDLTLTWVRTGEGQYEFTITNPELANVKLNEIGTLTVQQTNPGKQVCAVGTAGNIGTIVVWDGSSYYDGGLQIATMELTINTENL